jgi:hypothetical protein
LINEREKLINANKIYGIRMSKDSTTNDIRNLIGWQAKGQLFEATLSLQQGISQITQEHN